MKTNTLPAKAILAAIVAIVILPLGAAAACAAVTATGVISIFVADYGRTLEPVKAPNEAIPFDAPHSAAAEQREAA